MSSRPGEETLLSASATRRSGAAYGSGSNHTEWTTLKIAVKEPMPRAMVKTAVRVKPGLLRKARAAERKSWKMPSSWLKGREYLIHDRPAVRNRQWLTNVRRRGVTGP